MHTSTANTVTIRRRTTHPPAMPTPTQTVRAMASTVHRVCGGGKCRRCVRLCQGKDP